jgi:hypothetical protein
MGRGEGAGKRVLCLTSTPPATDAVSHAMTTGSLHLEHLATPAPAPRPQSLLAPAAPVTAPVARDRILVIQPARAEPAGEAAANHDASEPASAAPPSEVPGLSLERRACNDLAGAGDERLRAGAGGAQEAERRRALAAERAHGR